MNGKEVEEKPKLVKYQVYLTQDLQATFNRYINDKFSSEDRVVTAIMRKALTQFLAQEGYDSEKEATVDTEQLQTID